MPLLVKLALRNLFRHERRTLLTVAALALGIALMVLGRAWTAAMERAVVEPAKDGTLGHVQVYAKDAAADEGGGISFIVPQNNYRLIADPHDLIDRVVRAEPQLEAGLARLMIGALLSSGDTSLEAILIGIDPAARATVYPALALREGRFPVPGENAILLNRGVAAKLETGVGGTVVALGNTSDGRLSAVKLNVVGIWSIPGLESFEWGACFVSLAAVQELLDAGEAAGVVVLRQKDPRAAAAPIVGSLNEFFRREGIAAEAHSWEEMGGPFIGGVLLTRFIASVTDLIMAIIVAAGVANTALMAVFERTREIGTMRAIGARRTGVLRLFVLEGFLLGLLGAACGAGFGAALIVFLGRTGIPAFSEAQRYSYGGDYIYPRIDWVDVSLVPAVMLVICVLAALGPALMAARSRPAEALRYV